MRDVEQVLEESRKEALCNMDSAHPLNGGVKPDERQLKAWWHVHNGKIEMAWDLGLISEARRFELCQEWKTHYPA